MNLSEELDAIRGLLLEGEYERVREEIIQILQEEPRSAQAWVFAGELSETNTILTKREAAEAFTSAAFSLKGLTLIR